MQAKRYKRRIKLIKPRLQIKLTMIFVSISALALLLQMVLFTSKLTEVALDLPNDSLILMDAMNGLLTQILFTSFLAFLPLTFAVGVLSTFRLAGPLYRFEMFLKQLVRGEKPASCRLRKGDELRDFCELLNEATAPLRANVNADTDPPDVDSVQSPLGDQDEEARDAPVDPKTSSV